MKLKELYKRCIDDFTVGGIENPTQESRFLITEILALSAADFYVNPDREISKDEVLSVSAAVKRRLTGEPLQYILGCWDFMDNSFTVGPGVLIPRPETELLCQKVIASAEGMHRPVIYDLCSGSGCIGITLKKHLPEADVYLVEKSPEALLYLKKNVDTICSDKSPIVIQGDVLSYDSFEKSPMADIIVSNPPYIASSDIPLLQKEVSFEPEMALDGGADGLVFYRYIINKWKNKLKQRGAFFFEIGEDQGEAVSKILKENGFDSFIDKDYNNHDRMVIGRMK